MKNDTWPVLLLAKGMRHVTAMIGPGKESRPKGYVICTIPLRPTACTRVPRKPGTKVFTMPFAG